MIDSNYSFNMQSDLDLIPSDLIYSSLLGSSSNEIYDDYGHYEGQYFTNSAMVNSNDDPYYNIGYNVSHLGSQLETDYPKQLASYTSSLSSDPSALVQSSEVNYRYSSASSVSSSSDYIYSDQRPLSTTSLDSLADVNRSIVGCKRDLIKATLNFAIKSRRQSLGLVAIEVDKVKSQEARPTSWTDEDDEKKISRRERNRIAAWKCRKNRKLKYIGLNKTMENLDNMNNSLREQLVKLEQESEQLEDLLNSHKSQCYLVS